MHNDLRENSHFSNGSPSNLRRCTVLIVYRYNFKGFSLANVLPGICIIFTLIPWSLSHLPTTRYRLSEFSRIFPIRTELRDINITVLEPSVFAIRIYIFSIRGLFGWTVSGNGTSLRQKVVEVFFVSRPSSKIVSFIDSVDYSVRGN